MEKEKLFIGPKLRKNLFWTNKKFVIFFNCSNWEKIVEKIGENKIGCLVDWCHKQEIYYSSFIFDIFHSVHLVPDLVPNYLMYQGWKIQGMHTNKMKHCWHNVPWIWRNHWKIYSWWYPKKGTQKKSCPKQYLALVGPLWNR